MGIIVVMKGVRLLLVIAIILSFHFIFDSFGLQSLLGSWLLSADTLERVDGLPNK